MSGCQLIKSSEVALPKLRPIPWLATGLLLVAALPRSAPAQAFSTQPLEGPTAWPDNALPHTPARMATLLAEKLRTGLDHGEREGLREQIYAIVADQVRREFASSRTTAIPAADSTLASLFVEADRYGVMSANPVAHRLGIHTAPLSVLTPEFSLELVGDQFALGATTGRWQVRFPWYFMLWDAERVIRPNQPPIDVVSLSTLTAANAPQVGGASQATILIISSETDSVAPFTAEMLLTFGVHPSDTVTKAVPQALRTYARADRPRHMRAELTVLKAPAGVVLVGYFGLEGTYEANRQHYLDLLNAMRVH